MESAADVFLLFSYMSRVGNNTSASKRRNDLRVKISEFKESFVERMPKSIRLVFNDGTLLDWHVPRKQQHLIFIVI